MCERSLLMLYGTQPKSNKSVYLWQILLQSLFILYFDCSLLNSWYQEVSSFDFYGFRVLLQHEFSNNWPFLYKQTKPYSLRNEVISKQNLSSAFQQLNLNSSEKLYLKMLLNFSRHKDDQVKLRSFFQNLAFNFFVTLHFLCKTALHFAFIYI